MVSQAEANYSYNNSAPSGNNDEIDIGSLFRSIWRGKFWILLCALITTLIGGYYAFSVAVPSYSASSVVALESRQEQVVDFESVVSGLSGDQASINTEVEVMRSRGLHEKLVRELNLVEDPEFNPTLRDDSGLSLGKVISWAMSLVLGPLPEPEPLPDRAILDIAIDILQNKISVTNIRQSYVFRIRVETGTAQKSALIANTLADLYVLDQVETKFEATAQATSWLTDRVSQLQIDLETAEAKVKEFNANTELVSPEALGLLNFQIKELRDRLQELQKTETETKAKLEALNVAGAANDYALIAEIADDRALTRLHASLQENPEADTDAFDARFLQILNRAELELSRTSSQVATLEATVESQRDQIERQSVDLVELQQLQREAEASRLIYEYFLGRLKETSVQQGIQQADSRVLSRAVVPLSPFAPRKSVILAGSFVLGMLLGAVLVLVWEFLQSTYRTAEDLEAHTGYTVLGQIPAISARKCKNVLQYLIDKPTSATAEAIRNLRTSLLLSNVDNPPKIIMSTSSIPGEGKTTQSLALAQNLSGLGKKVLLVEGDIRRLVFAEYFEVGEKKGLISVLSGEVSLDDAVWREPSMGVDLLLGERTATNAADLFSSERFKKLLEDMRAKYDYVIIDTPPVLAVPDARVIGQSVDSILYTVKWDSTTQRQVAEGLSSLETVNIRATGLVLGQINNKGMKRYGYGDGHAAYGGYYDN